MPEESEMNTFMLYVTNIIALAIIYIGYQSDISTIQFCISIWSALTMAGILNLTFLPFPTRRMALRVKWFYVKSIYILPIVTLVCIFGCIVTPFRVK